MKSLNIILILFLLLIIFSCSFFFYKNSKKTEFLVQLIEKNNNYTQERVIFDSQGKNIYGLLIIPQSESKMPTIIVLPAAAGTKESREWYGKMFLEMGYATLILDQRGIGETGGYIPGIQEDYESFKSGSTSVQQLFVIDVINAVNVLSRIKEIDSNKIVVLGESMGGRYAIISTAKDKRIKAAFVISSSGYRGGYADERFNSFIASIDPNEYIPKIAPRKVVMFQSENDTVISIESAEFTYSLANYPKEFVLVKGCEHGYCEAMHEKLVSNLKSVFKS